MSALAPLDRAQQHAGGDRQPRIQCLVVDGQVERVPQDDLRHTGMKKRRLPRARPNTT